ncbi:MAG TPA: tRNA 2-thiocytidine biosynthesis TtcA family protein, partial [Candidatus Nanoarchaeia archaeon]|nr:tRNA 2-thiocytidine biosynthesis TtcA family protein [Candidatus Nanoarchaeia archaeon]
MEKAVYIDQAGNSYTRSKFIRYFEKKVMKTISKYNMIGKDDVVGVGLSGGKDSMTCLYIINKIQRERRRKVYAILIDEGIKGYRSSTIKDAKEFCKQHNIPLKIYKFSDVIGTTIDKVVRKENPCTTCGIFRRYVLNKAARDLKLDKIATGHNLDDEAQVLLMNQFKGNVSFSA